MGLGKLIFEIGLRGVEQVKKGLGDTKKGVSDVGKEAEKAAEKTKKFTGGVFAMAESAAKFTVHAAAVASGAGAIGTALGGIVGKSAFDAATKMDSLTRALATYSANGADLSGQLSRLKELAKLPGLGFEEAVQGSLRLQAVGFSARDAEKAIGAFGNAIAASGGGKEQLDGALLGLSQIISRGQVTMDNVNQIANAVPQIRAAMKAAFGTADGEQLQKMNIGAKQFADGVVTYFSKATKVSGGLQNSLDNIGDSIREVLLPLGKGIGIAFDSLTGPLDGVFALAKKAATAVGEVFAAAGTSGVLGDTLKKLTGLGDGMFGPEFQAGIAKTAATTLTVLGNIPEVFKSATIYADKMFKTIGTNTNTIFTYLESKALALTAFVVEFGKQIGEWAIFKPIKTIIEFNVKTLETLMGAFKDSAKLPGSELKFDKLPELPDFKGDLFKGYDENLSKIMGAIKPLPELPSGLPYGGAKNGIDSPATQTRNFEQLKKIEANTKKTADIMDLRASVLGGGPLASLGVTPAELLGGGRGGGGANGQPYGNREPVIQITLGGGGSGGNVTSRLEALFREIARDELARAPAGFRPRTV